MAGMICPTVNAVSLYAIRRSAFGPTQVAWRRPELEAVRQTMHFLVTNDDGIDAPGINALAELLAEWGAVTVVAPSGAWSGCSHQVTVDREVHVHQLESNRFA